ncbi:hypothetical protein BOX15_Mlig013633g1 [Macrostomum lignano]|uniref:Uncharacterized protein n=2 Tax=Macrostomum lignano TaxID=282301 RepID=A0A267H474_9PLAT|nr:hypothetical protein BOX15_Mlig013633g1 [Macrostomum lignano]
MASNSVIKPKTQAGKRALARREEKVIENTKSCLLIRGGNTSEAIGSCLKDLYSLKKPHALMLKRRNPILPFEEISFVEKMSRKYDCSLFAFASHSKKRPNNLVLGRLFNYQLLDMIEFGVEGYQPLCTFPVAKVPVGTKPCLSFQGEEFDSDPTLMAIKNLLLDMFQGPRVEKIRLQGIEHLIQFSYCDGQILVRSYRILLKSSGSKIPRVELFEMGPRFGLRLRRHKVATPEQFKQARRQPKVATIKKIKNIVPDDGLGNRLGRVHVGRQELDKLQTRKVKALKRPREDFNAADGKKIKKRRLSDNKKQKNKG